jgi:hypothetical protein
MFCDASILFPVEPVCTLASCHWRNEASALSAGVVCRVADHPLKSTSGERPFVQRAAAYAEGIVKVLVGSGTIAVKRHRKSVHALGCAADPRANCSGSALRSRSRPLPSTWPGEAARLGHLSAQPCAAHRRDGFVCGSHHQLCPVVRSGDRTTGSAGAGLDQCHKSPDGRVDRTTNN